MTAGAKEWGGEGKCLGFAELAEYRINSVKRRVYLFSDLGRQKKPGIVSRRIQTGSTELDHRPQASNAQAKMKQRGNAP